MDTQKKSQAKNHEGFTLVELLVVIAIIALLLAVLMPALNKARTIATGVVCASHLKDMGTMLEAYATENNGRMVPGFPYGARWWDRLGKYYHRTMSGADDRGTYALFRCPLEKKKNNNVAGEYGYNTHFACPSTDTKGTLTDQSDDTWSFSNFWWSKRERFKQPSTLPVFWDLNGDTFTPPPVPLNLNGYPHVSILKYGWDSVSNPRAGKKVTAQPTSFNGPAPCHGRKINYVFADGHAGSNGFWPYDVKSSPLTGQTMSFARPGNWDDYWTFFHPTRKLYVNGTSGALTVGDAWPGP